MNSSPSSAHALLVEDEISVLQLLQATMAFGGFTSDAASSAADALQKLDSTSYDVVLLDLGLPDYDGSALIYEMRARSEVGIVIVSGRDTQKEKIAALNAGADDFIGKPFLPGELIARVRAVVRRVSPDITLAPVEEQAGYGEGSQPNTIANDLVLTGMEKKLFDLLKEAKGNVVTVEQVISRTWGEHKERDIGHVRVLVAQLRRKLEAQEIAVRIINERGTGYSLIELPT